MRKSIHRWLQSGHFPPQIRALFINFQKRVVETSPPFSPLVIRLILQKMRKLLKGTPIPY